MNPLVKAPKTFPSKTVIDTFPLILPNILWLRNSFIFSGALFCHHSSSTTLRGFFWCHWGCIDFFIDQAFRFSRSILVASQRTMRYLNGEINFGAVAKACALFIIPTSLPFSCHAMNSIKMADGYLDSQWDLQLIRPTNRALRVEQT